jgi:hypothetical protein
MRAAALRLGGQGLSATHDDHLLIIGDAAGHIDPLTGTQLMHTLAERTMCLFLEPYACAQTADKAHAAKPFQRAQHLRFQGAAAVSGAWHWLYCASSCSLVMSLLTHGVPEGAVGCLVDSC